MWDEREVAERDGTTGAASHRRILPIWIGAGMPTRSAQYATESRRHTGDNARDAMTVARSAYWHRSWLMLQSENTPEELSIWDNIYANFQHWNQ